MAHLILPAVPSLEQTARRMQEAAKYDVADDEPTAGEFADLWAVRARPAPPKVPKVFLSNDCIFNCSYCGCRTGRDCPRYTSTPRELARIAVKQAEAAPHQGVFISSGIYRSADYTEELIVETLRIMRRELHFRGFIHAKIMPGADSGLIEQAGWLADRLSVNIELPSSEGYAVIAKQKNKANILGPMGAISRCIQGHAGEIDRLGRRFARGGQTTQLIVGAMKETDRTALVLAEALYRKYRLRRVYYSPFGRPSEEFAFFPEGSTPKWRTRRLYQADRLMQLYGFTADELLPEEEPDILPDMDPKAAWALRHLDRFPVEVNTADYETLLRVPGIGITCAQRIVRARRVHVLTHDLLRKLGVSLKRTRFFITCNGRYTGGSMLDSPGLRAVVRDGMGQLSLSDGEGASPLCTQGA